MDLGGAVDLLRNRVPGPVLVVLDGPQAREDARPDCDVDLAPLADVLRVQVVAHGPAPFERTASERARFEMQAPSRYPRLDEERRAVLGVRHLDDLRGFAAVAPRRLDPG
jgi:hypothetical protein